MDMNEFIDSWMFTPHQEAFFRAYIEAANFAGEVYAEFDGEIA